MHVTLVHVYVNPSNVTDFINATQKNHEASIKEPGNCRFDILQSPEEENHFILYEAYKNAESAAAHKETQHYLNWRDTVAPWMTKPRQGVKFNGLFPIV